VAETVLQNKEDCIEIDKRMSRVSAILSQLEKTEMLEEQDMENALTKLLETFLYAHSSWIARVAALPPSSFADHHANYLTNYVWYWMEWCQTSML
jgi:hypothetical protein